MMALIVGGGCGGARTLRSQSFSEIRRRPSLLLSSSSNLPFWSPQISPRNANIVAKAAKKLSSRTGKFEGKNRRRLSTETKEQEEQKRTVQIETDESGGGIGAVDVSDGVAEDGFVLPDLPGLEPDFWEGTQWEALGFLVQYLWAFGILFALLACGIAVATYNEGATNFKDTPVYKESVQSRELLEEPDGSNSDVFESNPTEEAPSLE